MRKGKCFAGWFELLETGSSRHRNETDVVVDLELSLHTGTCGWLKVDHEAVLGAEDSIFVDEFTGTIVDLHTSRVRINCQQTATARVITNLPHLGDQSLVAVLFDQEMDVRRAHGASIKRAEQVTGGRVKGDGIGRGTQAS